MKQIILFLTVLVSVVSCTQLMTPQTADYSWANRKWTLMEINGTPVQISGTEKDAHLYFSASDKRVSGSGGCNRINGNYSIDSYRLGFGEFAVTKMFCVDIAFENNFLAALRSVDQFQVLNNVLILKRGTIVLMRLR